MPVMVTLAIAILLVLAVIATRMTRRVKDQDARVEVARAQARDSILILITSYLDEQVDRSECILRIRVLLDGSCSHWKDELTLPAFLVVSDLVLSHPYGEARGRLDAEVRQAQDALRRQALQIHEQPLVDELTQLKEWLQS